MSDNDIVKGLNKENVDSGQEQLNKIKNIKKNIQIDLIKQYLPGMFIKFMFMSYRWIRRILSLCYKPFSFRETRL